MNTFERVLEFGRDHNMPMQSYTRLVKLLWSMFQHYSSVKGFAYSCKTAEHMDIISDWIEAEGITDWNTVAYRIAIDYQGAQLRHQ